MKKCKRIMALFAGSGRSFFVIAAFVALSGCAAVPETPPLATTIPGFLVATPSCAMVVGGSGSKFADPQVGEFWYEVNRQIAQHLFNRFRFEGYRVESLTVPPNESDDGVHRLVRDALLKNQCNQMVVVTDEVGEDGKGRYFQFNVMVAHIEPNWAAVPPKTPASSAIVIADYSRDYRYPRTPDSMESFQMDVFARSAYQNMRAVGALEKIQRTAFKDTADKMKFSVYPDYVAPASPEKSGK